MAKTKKQGMMKDALILCAISLIAALTLGFVNEITKDRIAELAAQKKIETYQSVFPDMVGIVDASGSEVLAQAMKDSEQILADGGFSGVTLDEVCLVQDADGQTIGYVASVTLKAYEILTLAFGYTTEGVCTGIDYLSIKETVGIGMKINEPEFKDQFVGKQADSFVAVKTGATAENEIDAVSGATFSTDGVITGMNAGIYFIKVIEELQTRLGGAE